MTNKSHLSATGAAISAVREDVQVASPVLCHKNLPFRLANNNAFSFIELLIVIAIVAILAVIAVPSFLQSVKSRNLVAATEDLYSYLQQARMESLSRSQSIYFNISAPGTDNWAYGINADTSCDPSLTSNISPSACVLRFDNGDKVHNDLDDNVLSRIDASQYPSIKLLASTTSINFEPRRGTASENVEITLSNGEALSTKIHVSRLGNLNICSSNLSDYQECKG
ncbi:GspH/FimT family pseudopilin [Thalassotalea litorea]|uniref:GspH/FimT family pseudopilin n=1 Tax=Thalassotalea litorea TaxID=2020715 RepID=UPI003734FF52